MGWPTFWDYLNYRSQRRARLVALRSVKVPSWPPDWLENLADGVGVFFKWLVISSLYVAFMGGLIYAVIRFVHWAWYQ